LFRLDGKVALVTGAARGIGYAVAEALGDGGATLVVNDVDEPGLEAAATRLRERGLAVTTSVFDVADTTLVASRISQMLDQLGRVDLLVNNAGILDFHNLLDMEEDCWDRMIGIHLKGTYNCTRPVFRHMVEHGIAGNIVNISSVAGKRGDFAGTVHYTAAKAGIIGFTRSLASLGGPKGIRVNAVAPGFTDTELNRTMPAATRATTEGNIALRRMARAEEIAAVVRFVASDAASYITGEVISVNGGSYMD
jgi:NAD(P)-dependent dehydrogenase (short-subunit alcohol dehydrogenase family)